MMQALLYCMLSDMHINRNTLLINTLFSFIAFCIYKTKVLDSLNNPNHLNKYIITECVKREAISLICVPVHETKYTVYTI